MKPTTFLALSLMLSAGLPAVEALRAEEAIPLVVLADPGRLGSIEKAAEAESLVDWRDDDPADDRACTESFAATELRHFLALALRRPEASIELSSKPRLPDSGTVIILITDPRDPRLTVVDTSGAPPLPASEESFRIFTDARPPRRVFVIQGRGQVGTLYGAYALLNRLGVRFYGLGTNGTVVPAPGAQLPSIVRLAEQPAYVTRGFWAWEPRGNRDFFLWMARNRMNLWTAEERNIPLLRKLGIRLTQGGHHIQKAFLDPAAEYPYALPSQKAPNARPPDPYAPSPDFRGDSNKDGRISYFEAHPEWYALIGKARSPHIERDVGDNYCTSNPDATRELVRNFIRSLEGGAWREADDVMFWMLDDGHWCTCDRCRAQGTPTDRLFAVLNVVTEALAEERAAGRLRHPITLMPLAFLDTMRPPSRPQRVSSDPDPVVVNWFPIDRCYVHALADPTCTEINRSYRLEFQQWASNPARTWKGPVCVGEYYNVGSLRSLPVVLTHIIGADIPWYYRHGARHFHYMHVPTGAWGPLTLNHAVLARLLWDPQVPADSVAREYFRLYYPATHATMRSFYAHLETATANLKLLKHRVRAGGRIFQLVMQLRGGVNPFVLAHMKYGVYRPAQNDGPDLVEVMQATRAARSEIDRALAHAPEGAERARLAEDERRFTYCEVTLEFYYHLIRLDLLQLGGHPAAADAEWPLLKASAERLRAMTDVALAASTHANAKDGLDATGLADIYQSLARRHAGSH